MAKIILKNTREHDISISVKRPDSNEIVTTTIPSAKQDPDDRSKLINGVGEIDDSLLEAAMEKPVVKHYFEAGWLVGEKISPRQARAASKE